MTTTLGTILSLFVVFPLFLLDAMAQGKASVVNYADDQLEVVYYPGRHQTQTVDIGGKQYLYFEDVEVTSAGKAGDMGLPTEAFIIGIPLVGKLNLEVSGEKFELSPNTRMAPIPEITFTQDSIVKIQRNFNIRNAFSAVGEGLQPSIPAEISKITWFRYQRIAVIRVYPYQHDARNNVLKTISSLHIRIHFERTSEAIPPGVVSDPLFESSYKSMLINYEQSRHWRGNETSFRFSESRPPLAKASDSTREWFDPLKQYYKIPISQDGIYKLSYTDLQNIGVSPQALDFHRLDIYYKGIPIPFRTVGEEDGQLNEGDYFEFFGTKLYDAPHVANEFSDTSVYWMTFEGGKNLRSVVDTVVAQNPEITAQSYEQTLRLEKDSIYYYGDGGLPSNNQSGKVLGEGWYSRNLFANQGTSFGFAVRNVYQVGNPNFQVLLRVHSPVYHQANPDHQLDISVNGTSIGRGEFNGYSDTTFSFSAPSNLLLEGDNTLSVRSNATQASSNLVMIDWLELHYTHSLAADSDSFTFSSNQVPINKVVSFQLKGFSAGDISAYRLDSLGGIEKTFMGTVSQEVLSSLSRSLTLFWRSKNISLSPGRRSKCQQRCKTKGSRTFAHQFLVQITLL